MSRFPGRTAIFVDPTGRRRRIARRAAVVLAALAIGYTGLLVSTLLGGPSVNTPLIPVPKAARPETRPEPTVVPSAPGGSLPAATPSAPTATPTTTSSSGTGTPTGPVSPGATLTPTPTLHRPTTAPGSPSRTTTTGPGRTNSPSAKPTTTHKPGTA